MLSKKNLVVAAGLLGSTYAQSAASTVTIDIYQATTTVTQPCSVCTTDAVPSAYTVVVSAGVTTTIGSTMATVVPAANPGSSGSDAAAGTGVAGVTGGTGSDGGAGGTVAAGCSFQLAVNGTTTLQQISDGQIQAHITTLGQISDGQIQSGSGLSASTFTVSNNMVYDQAGRICSVSGQNQAQFQCNDVPTTGSTTTSFTLLNNYLAFDGSTSFYACLLGDADDGYNIYQQLTGVQNGCSPIVLQAIDLTGCSAATTSVTPAAPLATVPAPAAQVSPVAPVASSPVGSAASTTSNTLPTSTALPISTNGAGQRTSYSIAGLALGAALSYIVL